MNDCCKTTIHISESFKNIQIDGKDKGKCHPPAGSKESARQLFPKSRLSFRTTIWKILVYQIPEESQKRKCEINPQMYNLMNCFAYKRCMFINHNTDTVTEYGKYQ